MERNVIKVRRLGNPEVREISMEKYNIKELKEIISFWEGLKDYETELIY